MAQTRALVKRRKAVRNIRKITRTMELIATARFAKAQQRAVEADAFTRKITELAADLTRNAGGISHPLLVKRDPIKKSLLLVITSNRGLCGGYNAGILREAGTVIREVQTQAIDLHLEVSGKRGIAYCRYQGLRTEQTFTQFEDKPTFEQVEEIANRYIALYVEGAVDRVQVAYQKYLSGSRQVPVVETLLPLDAVPGAGAAETGKAKTVEYEFLPSAREILEEILPVSFKVRLFKCFLDAAVSEQIARRVAMKAATENAGEMIRDLSLKYNRARQAAITKEISEVIGGAAALE
jgi:F-type H+-transporting ATPase subunit gamma